MVQHVQSVEAFRLFSTDTNSDVFLSFAIMLLNILYIFSRPEPYGIAKGLKEAKQLI